MKFSSNANNVNQNGFVLWTTESAVSRTCLSISCSFSVQFYDIMNEKTNYLMSQGQFGVIICFK